MGEHRKKRFTIAIMIGDIQSDYSEEVLRGFFTCAKEEDINLIFLMGPQIPQYCADILDCNLQGNYNYQFDTVYDYVSMVQADALIIAYGSVSMFHNIKDKKEFLKQYQDIPHLVIEDTAEDAPYLISDNYVGMQECIRHLVKDHGYRKVLYLSGPEGNHDARERRQAYLDVMEEYGIPVTESMIAYGNYTELVDAQVNDLLDQNPGAEAIACANDNMAKGCYRVCRERGIRVGEDLAVTGFDNVDMARMMTPPLTSVSQGSFWFSYTALKNAIALCEGKTVASKRMPTVLQKRASCGCSLDSAFNHTRIAAAEMKQYITETTERIAADLLAGIPYEKDRLHYEALIQEYFQYIYRTMFEEDTEEFQMEYLLNILQKFLAYPHVSSVLLFERFSNLIQILIANVEDVNRQKCLAYIVSRSQQFIHSHDSIRMEQRMNALNRKAWFVPSFTRDLNRRGSKDDYREVMFPLMERLKMMNVRSCYIYLFEKPIIYERDVKIRFPKTMYLTAYYNKREMRCYPNAHRPLVTADNGFSSFIPQEKAEILNSFLLFSDEKQYGIMLCEVDQEDVSFLHISGLQVGSLLRYLELNWMEQEAHEKLKSSLKVIREQNHILSFISEYDELTNLLNRRGFMERAIACCKQNDGRKAYMIFSDLDHLKEINDCFGHAAGDYAIKTAAYRLKEVLPKDAITARIGGDEFVSLVVSEMPGFDAAVSEALKEAQEQFDKDSDIPYYIELSVGMHEFDCMPQIKMGEIMERSDELLYQAKKHRRKSIRKFMTQEMT